MRKKGWLQAYGNLKVHLLNKGIQMNVMFPDFGVSSVDSWHEHAEFAIMLSQLLVHSHTASALRSTKAVGAETRLTGVRTSSTTSVRALPAHKPSSPFNDSYVYPIQLNLG